MEQHPVPRNISGFQFHLIGDMTLRQFAYLAAGAFVGYIIYKAAPFSAIINIPLALSCGFAGFAFAFLPIQERPLDKWIAAFIKSIMSPTQYIWTKNNQPPDILTRSVAIHIQVTQPQHQAHKETNEKLRAYLSTLPVPIHESLNAAEKRYIDKTLSLFQTSAAVATSPSLPFHPQTVNMPSLQQINKPVSPQIQPVDKQIPEIKPPQLKEEPEEHNTTPTVVLQTPNPIPQQTESKDQIKENHNLLQEQLAQLAAEKKALEQELQKLQQQVSGSVTPQIIKPVASSEEKSEPTIKVVSPKSAVSEMGMFNYQQAPNLIAGVIKDPQRKLLPNIILTIKDKNGLPVRALKTNKLGQFSTATPLPNSTYLLEIEDPMKRYVFDIAQIILSGKVFLPIEIIAKGEKELMREQLTKELFGTNPI